MNNLKKFGMAACVCFLVAVLNLLPVSPFTTTFTAEAATVSAENTSLGQLRDGGFTTIKISSSAKIKSVSASASNNKAKATVKSVSGQKARVSVKGLKPGSTTIKVKVKLTNGQKFTKKVSLTVYNVDRYNFLYKVIRKEGFSKNEALGIMANLLWETGPVNMSNKGSFTLATLSRQFVDPSNHSGSYYGMFQLEGSRKEAMKRWCKNNGYKYSSVRGQVKFMAHEMKTSETYARKMLKKAKTAKEAAVMFASYYERCGTAYRAPRGITAQRLDLFF